MTSVPSPTPLPDTLRDEALAALADILDRALDGDRMAYHRLCAGLEDHPGLIVSLTQRHARGYGRRQHHGRR